MSERELSATYPLVDATRRLHPGAVGWSRQPLCDATIRGPFGRRKRWNYWSFNTPELHFVAAIVDADFMRVAFVHLLTYGDGKWREGRLTLPPIARLRLGGRVDDAGEFRWGRRRIAMVPGTAGVDVRVDWPGFPGGDLHAELRATPLPGQQSINVTIPWSETRFHFTSKQPAIPAVGTVRVGAQTLRLEGPDSFAALDFGRGVWRYDSMWNWTSASGRDARGRVVGLNLGAGWTDGTPMTENGVVLDGVAHKIARAVRFAYDPHDMMRPWRIHSPDSDAVDLRVTPFYRHRLSVDLGVLSSKLDQVFGHIAGELRLPGDTVSISGLVATCEEQQARW